MKKIFLLILCAVFASTLFAQVRVTATDFIEIRTDQDPQKTKTSLNMLRNTFDLTLVGGKIDLWYRARFDMSAWASVSNTDMQTNAMKAFLPMLGDAQLRVYIRPISELTLAVGTEMYHFDLGPYSLWDADYNYVGFGKTYRSFWDFQNNKTVGVRPSWTNGDNVFGYWEKARMPSRFLNNGIGVVYTKFGVSAGINVPFQGMTEARSGDFDNFALRYGVKYTMPKAFTVGAGWASRININKNPFSFYIGGTFDLFSTVKPEIFFTYFHRGLDFTENLVSQTNVGARVRLKFQFFTFEPEFAVSIDSLGKNTSQTDSTYFNKTYLVPFFIAVPVSYKINNTFLLGFWTSFATGDKKSFLDIDAEYKPVFDYRIVLRPGVEIVTKAGTFRIQYAGILESLPSMQQPVKYGYMLYLFWSIRAY